MSNPRVSEEAKQHAREMIDALGGDQPRAEMKQFDREKDQTRVAGGLKAYAFFFFDHLNSFEIEVMMIHANRGTRATQNPRNSDAGKGRAQEKLQQMGGPSE